MRGRGDLQLARREARRGGRPLEARERGDMERTLGQPFGAVRIHTDSPLAGLTGAAALTIGNDIFFGPGLYASGRPESRALLAHELTHVAQNAGAARPPDREVSHPGDASEREASSVERAVARGHAPRGPIRASPSAAIHRQPAAPAPDMTAPIADYSREPRLEILDKVVEENKLYARASALLPWLEGRATSTPTFTRKELFDDKAATATFDTPPATAAALDPVLDLLAHHNVIEHQLSLIGADDKPIDPAFKVVMVTERFDEKQVPEAYPDYRDPKSPSPFYKALNKKPFLAAMGRTAAIEQAMRKRAPEAGKRGEARTAILTGWPPPTPLVETTKVTSSLGTGPTADRAFANSIVALFRRLRAINAAWSVGQYPGHDYTEYSADIYPSGGAQANGFYVRSEVIKFFDDLNTAAKDASNADGFGLFAWRAIYNDEPLQDTVNAKYGPDRVISAPGHGPLGPRALAAGMKPPKKPKDTHIHLDLRPMDLSKDVPLDFAMQGNRVVPK
ncbi:MAG TPA: DUF4157 domain-containing protein [Kofleriaceae bacterium]|nr:DUF4157 domain-containing protein [Kofleriaceae bacterium]